MTNQEKYFQWRKNRAKPILKLAQQYTNFWDKKILDAGCGEGSLALQINTNNKICAIDNNGNYIISLQERDTNDKVEALWGSIDNLPYKSKTFDIIFSYDVLEHTSEPNDCLYEMTRCLKDDGKMFIEISPYYSLICGHHLSALTYLPMQYLPKKFVWWWIKDKKNKMDTPFTNEFIWTQFLDLNHISITKLKYYFLIHSLDVLEENYFMKVSRNKQFKINWVRHIPILKELLTTNYQVVLIKNKR